MGASVDVKGIKLPSWQKPMLIGNSSTGNFKRKYLYLNQLTKNELKEYKSNYTVL